MTGKVWRRAMLGRLLLVAAGALSLAGVARAQSSAALLVKPWDADQTVEDQTTDYLFAGGHTEDGHHTFDLDTVESQGRLRLFPGNIASPRLGYDLTYLNTNTSQAGFPGQLLDFSVAGGTFLSETNGWVTGITLGVGYAGEAPFGTGRAWYGRADFVLAKKFNDQDSLGIGLDYDGHRTYAPDVPLPGFGWSHQFDPKLQMVIGAPISSITWKPIDHLRIYADYLLLTDFDIDIGWEFIHHWTVFGAFESRDDAFWIDELNGRHRLIYAQRRIEAGVRWQPVGPVTLSLSAGEGLWTDFRSGWDERHSTRVLYASNEPFLRAGLEIRF